MDEIMKLNRKNLRRMILEEIRLIEVRHTKLDYNEMLDIAKKVKSTLESKGINISYGDVGEGDVLFRLYFDDDRHDEEDDSIPHNAVSILKAEGFDYDYEIGEASGDWLRYIPIVGPTTKNMITVHVYPKFWLS